MRIPLAAVTICLAGAAAAQDPAAAPPGALACSGCHGAGSSLSLDGLTAADIETAMIAFREGTREATLMTRLAAGFSDAEIAAIAAWLAGEDAQ